MLMVVGIRYSQAGKIYYFDPAEHELMLGDMVVVETSGGPMLGSVAIPPVEKEDEKIIKPLKKVVRKATMEDVTHAEENKLKEREALNECDAMAKKLELSMKLIAADYNLNRSKLTIFFTAESRVDFRELVREIGHKMKMRIELRQVGPRDEAKMMGGYGRCGFNLCCRTFLTEFNPVSIKMAKEQNLPLNSMKISGVCGRLLCCLGYEYEQYRTTKAKLPRYKDVLKTPVGEGKVVAVNVIKETVTLEMESGVSVEYPYAEIADYQSDIGRPVQQKETINRKPRRPKNDKT
jgi:cell fate regulator YaaT (PSP1 superfamily)